MNEDCLRSVDLHLLTMIGILVDCELEMCSPL